VRRVRQGEGVFQRQAPMQLLPIKGLFYRWGLDFAGPLPKSRQGHQYVLVMVEHFSKQIILVATRDKEPSTVAAAFTREVLTRFGACAEVVTDQGGEFGGEFQACLDAAFIDHRATSAYHPQANGLSERVVGIVKRSLRKWCLGHASEEWDAYLPRVAMGYNFSAQASLAGFSPYQLLFGREPVVPGAIKVALEEALDLDEPERLAALVAQRAVLPAVDAHGDGQLGDRAAPGHVAVREDSQWGVEAAAGPVRSGGLRLLAAGDARHVGHPGGGQHPEGAGGGRERGSGAGGVGRADSPGACRAVRTMPPARCGRQDGSADSGTDPRLRVHTVLESERGRTDASVRRVCGWLALGVPGQAVVYGASWGLVLRAVSDGAGSTH
jgi:transposase InsO family protein